jgi:hypothetical protein
VQLEVARALPSEEELDLEGGAAVWPHVHAQRDLVLGCIEGLRLLDHHNRRVPGD